ncbi:MAG: hypothetical protein IKU48_03145 [Clostridia bacterium]|nr:hypothetical protein [Clostridia bacterium]
MAVLSGRVQREGENRNSSSLCVFFGYFLYVKKVTKRNLKECNFYRYICLEGANNYRRDIVFKRVLISLFFILSWCQESIAKKAQGGRAVTPQEKTGAYKSIKFFIKIEEPEIPSRVASDSPAPLTPYP